MKRQLKKIVAVLSILTIVISLLNVKNVDIVEAKSITNFTGEELFKGIIFGQGEVANELPFMWTEDVLKETNSPEAKEVVDDVIAMINKVNPDYFSELKKAIDSENRVALNSLINETGQYLDEYAKQMDLENPDQEALNSAQGRSIIAAVGAIVYLGGAVTTVLLVTHAVALTAGVAKYGWKYTYQLDGSGNQFTQENMVNNVIESLSAN